MSHPLICHYFLFVNVLLWKFSKLTSVLIVCCSKTATTRRVEFLFESVKDPGGIWYFNAPLFEKKIDRDVSIIDTLDYSMKPFRIDFTDIFNENYPRGFLELVVISWLLKSRRLNLAFFCAKSPLRKFL